MHRALEWLAERLDLPRLSRLVAEALREFGLLWAVFSVLDRIVSASATASWLVINLLFSFLVWLVGAVLEVRRPRKETRTDE